MNGVTRLAIGMSALALAVLIPAAGFGQQPIEAVALEDVHVEPVAYADCCDCDPCCDCSHGCLTGGIFGPCSINGDHRSCYDHHRRRSLADKHAPAGLMGGHLHEPGEWMFEYKYMSMYMDGNQAGRRNVTDAQAFGFDGTNVAATPTNMTMEMHMIHIMYGWKEDVTLYIMPMLTSLTMDHLRNNPFPPTAPPGGPLAGQPFTTHNSGFDDLVFGALWRIHEGCDDELILNIGCSVPTGDIDRTTTVPTNGAMIQELPYPMRRGSGTFDFRPGITYKRYFDWGSVGMQYQADLPVGHNSDNYSVSKEHRVNAWATWLPCDRLAFSYRVEGLFKSNYTGRDLGLGNPAIISTARPDMRGGDWLNFGYGASLLVGNGNLLTFEAVHPVYEYLNGIQLSNDWWMFASVSRAF